MTFHSSILNFSASQGWAMLPERADELASIVLDHAAGIEKSPEVLEAYRSRTAEKSERANVRDGVGILRVEGPLFKKANLFVEISGATSYEILRRDLQALLDDTAIHSILLLVDSPGGEANGCDELASAIFAARGKKPITAYVSGMAASGGYWIASAADRVVVSDLALLGSIGVVLGVQDRSQADAKRGMVEFVSSKSPGKRPNPSTDAGRDRIQSMVDDLADVFIAAVAKHRGVSPEKVVSDFGEGGMKVGANAVAAGMADELGQLESTIQSIISSGRKSRFQPRSTGGSISMSDKTETGPTAEEIAEKAAADAQTRISAIIGSDLGGKMRPLAEHLAFKTKISADDCKGILEAADKSYPIAVEGIEPEGEGSETNAGAKGGQNYLDRKRTTGALGAVDPPAGQEEQQKVKAGWGKAFGRINAA